MSSLYCPNCGSEVVTGTNFCYNCGLKFEPVTTTNEDILFSKKAVEDYTNDYKNKGIKKVVFKPEPEPPQPLPPEIDLYFKTDSKKLTPALKTVLGINYFLVLITFIFGILILFISIPSGIIFLLLGVIYGKLIFEVQKYNNIARMILIGILLLGVAVNLTSVELDTLFTLFILCFELYVLIFDSQTKVLFEQS
ncbi:MAG: zinc ribbon domain-containing protein [Candidatus Thorarchaeota archaeon]